MTALRQKMLEDMQLHGLAARTQESYLRVVHQLAAHYHKPLANAVSCSMCCPRDL